jgi:3'-phosphoadenosine 5'-phosphosulfate sulfotransferase (PAPS reductase)/FAD synthetase
MPRTLPILNAGSPAIHVPPSFPPIALTPLVSEQLARAARVGVGVSGGADSAVAAYLVAHHLESIGYHGECVLIYSDLGMIEWRASRPLCELLAERLGLELIVVKADMIARWEKRWRDNLARYSDLRCVKLIMPWSGPGLLRFCTSEEKLDPISRALVRRFPGLPILSASGIRHDESASRKLAPICKAQPRLVRKKAGTIGWDWHPIVEWTKADVLAYHQDYDIPLHPAYTQFGCSRVSCVYCVLSSRHNLSRATLCAENHEPYRRIVMLEIASAFSFQSGSWLGDISPHLLVPNMQADLAQAKRRAHRREEIEATIAPGLLYQKGWPTVLPTIEEARQLGEVRKAVADLVGITVRYTQSGEIRERFAELMAIAELRAAQQARKKHTA